MNEKGPADVQLILQKKIDKGANEEEKVAKERKEGSGESQREIQECKASLRQYLYVTLRGREWSSPIFASVS